MKNECLKSLKGKLAEENVKQKEVAEILGISERQASKKLNGKCDFWVDELIAISDRLGVSAAIFLP